METWQRDHINSNLAELIQSTVCNEVLFSKLIKKGILSSNDLADLMSKRTSFEKAFSLYTLVQGRVNSYGALTEALSETRQSGVYSILDQLNSRNIRTPFKNAGQISYNKNILIGKGCNNTKVFSGFFSGRNVAVKRVNIEDLEEEKVLQEIEFLKQLDSHENIVTYYNAEMTEDYVLIALEKCSMSLHEYIGDFQDFDRWCILRQIAAGIAYLHRNNIVHGDVKPANVLLKCQGDDYVKVKITDFGLSKKLPIGRSYLTKHSTSGLGTEGWIAPEILKSTIPRVSRACDIFSLGCVYYFVLASGEHPFGDPNHQRANIVEDKPLIRQQDLRIPENEKISATQLILEMVSSEPASRPSAEKIVSYEITTIIIEEDMSEGTINKTHDFLADLEADNVALETVGAPDHCPVNVLPVSLDEQVPVPAVVSVPDVHKPKQHFGRKVEKESKRVWGQIRKKF